jgi:Transposase zinc-binding domain
VARPTLEVADIFGGHVTRCEKCPHTVIAYNSFRNRHCPKCQGAAAKQWLAECEADLLRVPYYHIVFTLPAPISDIAYQKAELYDILFKRRPRRCLPSRPTKASRSPRWYHFGSPYLGLGAHSEPLTQDTGHYHLLDFQ